MNKKLLTLVALPFIALPLVACGPKSTADAAKAKQVASAADQQLKADGYDATHLPGFGKFDLGIAPGKQYKYEIVYTIVPKHEALVRDGIQQANSKPEPGVQIRLVEDTLVVADATSLKDLKTAAKTILKAAGV